jgi:hypothetical protein
MNRIFDDQTKDSMIEPKNLIKVDHTDRSPNEFFIY